MLSKTFMLRLRFWWQISSWFMQILSQFDIRGLMTESPLPEWVQYIDGQPVANRAYPLRSVKMDNVSKRQLEDHDVSEEDYNKISELNERITTLQNKIGQWQNTIFNRVKMAHNKINYVKRRLDEISYVIKDQPKKEQYVFITINNLTENITVGLANKHPTNLSLLDYLTQHPESSMQVIEAINSFVAGLEEEAKNIVSNTINKKQQAVDHLEKIIEPMRPEIYKKNLLDKQT